jgi:hypothetical protein
VRGNGNEEQQDFAAKLALIESEAYLAAESLPPSTVRDRIQHIAVVAQLLKARLNVTSLTILPPSQQPRRSKT